MLLQVGIPDFAFGGWPEAFLPPWASARCVSGGITAFPANKPGIPTRTVSYTQKGPACAFPAPG